MLDRAKHKDILERILKDIYTDNTLGPALGFKGGTAAMLFYDLPRFSVDLDFDLLAPDMEDMVYKKVGEIVAAYGKIVDQKKKYFTLLYEMSYAEKDRNVKVEISRRSTGSRYEVKNYFGIAMKIMVQEDMFANKLLALYTRGERTYRDIFDTWFFLQKAWSINKKLVEEKSGRTLRDVVSSCIRIVEKVPDRNILTGMGELLDAKQKAWVRSKLKLETLYLLRIMLANEK